MVFWRVANISILWPVRSQSIVSISTFRRIYILVHIVFLLKLWQSHSVLISLKGLVPRSTHHDSLVYQISKGRCEVKSQIRLATLAPCILSTPLRICPRWMDPALHRERRGCSAWEIESNCDRISRQMRPRQIWERMASLCQWATHQLHSQLDGTTMSWNRHKFSTHILPFCQTQGQWTFYELELLVRLRPRQDSPQLPPMIRGPHCQIPRLRPDEKEEGSAEDIGIIIKEDGLDLIEVAPPQRLATEGHSYTTSLRVIILNYPFLSLRSF